MLKRNLEALLIQRLQEALKMGACCINRLRSLFNRRRVGQINRSVRINGQTYPAFLRLPEKPEDMQQRDNRYTFEIRMTGTAWFFALSNPTSTLEGKATASAEIPRPYLPSFAATQCVPHRVFIGRHRGDYAPAGRRANLHGREIERANRRRGDGTRVDGDREARELSRAGSGETMNGSDDAQGDCTIQSSQVRLSLNGKNHPFDHEDSR
jgi:hypothetical protein